MFQWLTTDTLWATMKTQALTQEVGMIKDFSPALGTFVAEDDAGDSLEITRRSDNSYEVNTSIESGDTVRLTTPDANQLLQFLLAQLSDDNKVVLAHDLLTQVAPSAAFKSVAAQYRNLHYAVKGYHP